MRPLFFSSTRRGYRQGFTLVELLAVIAIVILLSVAAVPTIGKMFGSGKFTSSVTQVSGVLEQARQYAIAQNTYIWVAFAPDTSVVSEPEKSRILILASRNGMDPLGWAGQVNLPHPDLEPIGNLAPLPRMKVLPAGTLTLTGDTAPHKIGEPLNENLSFTTGASGTTIRYGSTIRFSPNGEARVSEAPASLIELGLQPTEGKTGDANNVALIQINGLTGNNRVYRP